MLDFNITDLMSRDDNAKTLQDFFVSMVDGTAYDGTSHQLYLDLNDGEIIYNHEVSSNTWLQRDDGSLKQILFVSGYDDTPPDDLYYDGCDLLDYGYSEWLDYVADQINSININKG